MYRPHPHCRTGWAMLLYASTLHFGWAVLIALSPSVMKTTPLYGLGLSAEEIAAQVTGLWQWPTGLVIAVMGLAAGAAVLGATLMPGLFGLALMLPQQFLLLVSAVSAALAAYHGAYPDGVLRPWPFILADQLPVILAAPLYTLAVLTHASDSVL